MVAASPVIILDDDLALLAGFEMIGFQAQSIFPCLGELPNQFLGHAGIDCHLVRIGVFR